MRATLRNREYFLRPLYGQHTKLQSSVSEDHFEKSVIIFFFRVLNLTEVSFFQSFCDYYATLNPAEKNFPERKEKSFSKNIES